MSFSLTQQQTVLWLNCYGPLLRHCHTLNFSFVCIPIPNLSSALLSLLGESLFDIWWGWRRQWGENYMWKLLRKRNSIYGFCELRTIDTMEWKFVTLQWFMRNFLLPFVNVRTCLPLYVISIWSCCWCDVCTVYCMMLQEKSLSVVIVVGPNPAHSPLRPVHICIYRKHSQVVLISILLVRPHMYVRLFTVYIHYPLVLWQKLLFFDPDLNINQEWFSSFLLLLLLFFIYFFTLNLFYSNIFLTFKCYE